MTWDLATILVVLTAVSGVIWIFDTLFLAPKRGKNPESEDNIPFVIDLARSLLPVFFIVLFLRSFLVEPFRIPSGSMMPTLLIGDFILVNKFSYGIRLPVANKKIIEIGKPERGDVVVFRYPENPAIPFIKRVVGLPGDKITYNDTNKILYINGKVIEQEVIGRYMGVGSGSGMTGREHRKENLTGVEHDILVKFETNPYSSFGRGEWVVPEKHYFVLGDNRDNSKDSRYWGFVPEENLIGKAFFIWMNWDLANGGVSAQRIGTQIK